jgi:formylglycine-generating enzyme required for sulfatase activity
MDQRVPTQSSGANIPGGILAILFLVVVLIGCTTSREGGGASDGGASSEQPDLSAQWVTIKAGTFQIGSPAGEPGRLEIEGRHEVTLTTDFLMQATEVTQQQFESLLGYNPSHFVKFGPSAPAEDMSWHEAAAYVNKLSENEDLPRCYSCTGKGRDIKCQRNASSSSPYTCPGYRLPTEAEWEYAARAGDTRATSNGDPTEALLECESPNPVLDPIAWFCGNSDGHPHPVGQKQPNAWGLYDILGNVWEWNHDWDSEFSSEAATDPWGPIVGLSRLGHGGSWLNKGRLTRFAARGGGSPDETYGFLGMRVVKSIL